MEQREINIINFEEFQDVVINAKKLIEQIEMADFKDENDFRLKNNIHYKELAESIDELID
nr:MAG TPA: hypothetical protein [Caudoviricetes sp.]